MNDLYAQEKAWLAQRMREVSSYLESIGLPADPDSEEFRILMRHGVSPDDEDRAPLPPHIINELQRLSRNSRRRRSPTSNSSE